MSGVTQVPSVHEDPTTRSCTQCGADSLLESWSCHGCGRPFFAVQVTDREQPSREKHYYVSAGARRRMHSMAMLSTLIGTSLVE